MAWSLCAATFAGVLLVFWLMFLNGANFVTSGIPFVGVASAVVGALVASRQPRNVVGWLFLASALFSAVRAAFGEYGVYGYETSPGAAFAEVSLAASVVLAMPGPIIAFVLIPFYFPNGKPPSRRWGVLVWPLLAFMPVVAALDSFSPGSAVYGADIPNPLGMESLATYAGTFEAVLIGWFIVLIFIAAASLVFRFRNSSGMERQQIKWLAFAAAIIPVWFTVGGMVESNFRYVFSILDSLIIAAVPVAAGVAILRYRLYDIDLLINKTLVYASLTASLVAVYFSLVIGSEYLLRTFIGENSQLVVVASTLAIAALFSPFRRSIQNFIDRRFYRRRYNARETLDAFSARLRGGTNLDDLANDLASVARKTMQPAHASLWLRPTGSRSDFGSAPYPASPGSREVGSGE